jgi:hypothetical protein
VQNASKNSAKDENMPLPRLSYHIFVDPIRFIVKKLHQEILMEEFSFLTECNNDRDVFHNCVSISIV